MAGIQMPPIPYKSGPAAMTDLIGGQVNMFSADFGVTVSQHKAGKIRGLAVTSTKRSAAVPELPTIAESGGALAGFDIHTWFGLFGPAKLPADVTQKLNKAFVEALPSRPEPALRATTA